MISINVLVIIVVSFKALCRKMYLNKLKKEAKRKCEEILERKK